jgi:uncharacterized membrane protein
MQTKSKFLTLKGILIYLFIILFAVQFSTCTKDVVVKEPCFQEEVLPIFTSKCSMEGCHNSNGKRGGHGFNFTNYDGIMKGVKPKYPNKSKVYTTCNGLFASMPPKNSEQLTKVELSTIKYWIKMGAKNTSNCNGTACDTANYKFATDIQPIISKNCVGCHNANSLQGNVDLSTYSLIVSSAASGNLLGCVKQIDSKYKPMSPSYKINDCNISKLEKWINSGTPNN